MGIIEYCANTAIPNYRKAPDLFYKAYPRRCIGMIVY